MDFSAWIVSGLMVVAGATWLIVYNADVVLGLAMRVLGRVRASRRSLKMAMAYPLRVPLPHRHHAGDVHARRVHDRRRRDDVARVPARPSTTSSASAAASTSARRSRPASPLADPGTPDPRAPAACRELDFTVVAGESVVPAKARQAGDEAFARLPRARLRPAVPQHHDRTGSRRDRHGLRLAARGVGRDGRDARPRRRRRVHRPAARQLELRRRRRDFRLHGLLRRGPDVRARSRRRARPADRAPRGR